MTNLSRNGIFTGPGTNCIPNWFILKIFMEKDKMLGWVSSSII